MKHIVFLGIIIIFGLLVFLYSHATSEQKPLTEKDLSVAIKKIRAPLPTPYLAFLPKSKPIFPNKNANGFIEYLLGCETSCP